MVLFALSAMAGFLIINYQERVTKFTIAESIDTGENVRKDWCEARASELALKQKEVDLQRALIELEELNKKVSQ